MSLAFNFSSDEDESFCDDSNKVKALSNVKVKDVLSALQFTSRDIDKMKVDELYAISDERIKEALLAFNFKPTDICKISFDQFDAFVDERVKEALLALKFTPTDVCRLSEEMFEVLSQITNTFIILQFTPKDIVALSCREWVLGGCSASNSESLRYMSESASEEHNHHYNNKSCKKDWFKDLAKPEVVDALTELQFTPRDIIEFNVFPLRVLANPRIKASLKHLGIKSKDICKFLLELEEKPHVEMVGAQLEVLVYSGIIKKLKQLKASSADFEKILKAQDDKLEASGLVEQLQSLYHRKTAGDMWKLNFVPSIEVADESDTDSLGKTVNNDDYSL